MICSMYASVFVCNHDNSLASLYTTHNIRTQLAVARFTNFKTYRDHITVNMFTADFGSLNNTDQVIKNTCSS